MPRGRSDDSSAEWIGRLYDRFAGALCGYAVMMLADPHTASDVVQQVFVSLLRQRRAIVNQPEHYLRRAVRNECYSHLRRRVRDASSGEPQLLEPIAPFDDVEVRLTIEQALRELPPEQREVVHLKVFESMTFLKNSLLAERATILDSFTSATRRNDPTLWALRPWMLQVANRRIERLAGLIEASNRPWPRKLDPITRDTSGRSDVRDRAGEANLFVAHATSLAYVRCARMAVAVSRYRAEHHRMPASLDELVPSYLGEKPIDPYSGPPLRYTIDAAGFSVQSAGWRRRVEGVRRQEPGISIRIR